MGNTPNIRFKGFTDDWEQRKWIDTVDISTEMVDPTTGEYDDMPHIAPGNIEPFTGRILDNVKTVKEEQLISGKFRFRPNDVVYGKINPQLGKYFYASIDGLTSADAYVFNGKNGITQKFLYSVLQTKDFFKYSISVSKRSGMPKINRDELNAYSFCVPKEEEQEKIGDFLLGIDNLITLHQRKLFLNFVKKNDWEQRKLGEICQRVIRKNKNNESDLPLTIASQYGLIDQRDFFNKVVAAKDMSNYYLLRKGEFAYNKSYSNGFEYGSIKRLNAYEQGCLSTLYICFEITSDEVDSDYLECFFDTLKWYGDLSMICAEGARNHGLLNVDIKAFFADINVSTPTNLKEQRKIATYLNNLDHLITLHRRAYYNKKGGLTNVHNDNQQHYAIL